MKSRLSRTAAPLITTIQKLFSEDLAKENDFLRQENKILRSKLGKRVLLTEADRRTLIGYGLPIKERLADVISIVRPETLLAWNRRMKRRKWTFDNRPKRLGRPPKNKATEELVVRLAEENAWGYVRIAERFVRESRETLDSMILLGGHHFHHVLKRIEHHHNRQRPHQGLGNMIPLGLEYPSEPASADAEQCESSLGGLLNHYYVEKLAA